MPLPLPHLDDRRWKDLVAEGQALIPRYAPTWTDHNVHDPGITLIELFAWLAEMNIYGLNQIPERHRRKFLALIGYLPRPAQPAQALLAFQPGPGTAAFSVSEGTVFTTSAPPTPAVAFQTRHAITVVDARLVAIQVDAGGGPRSQKRALKTGLPFAPFGTNSQPGNALYLGFDQALPTGVPLSLGLHVAGRHAGPQERARILAEARAQAEACRPLRPGPDCNGHSASVTSPAVRSLPLHHGAKLLWEVYDGSTWVAFRPEAGDVVDDTRALILDGTVRLMLPTTHAALALGDCSDALFYLRCRLAPDSRYDTTPMLAWIGINAVFADQRIPVWQRLPIDPGATVSGPLPAPGDDTRLAFELDPAGAITNLTFAPGNTAWPSIRVLNYEGPATAAPGLTFQMVWFGDGDDIPEQQMTLPRRPVEAAGMQLYTLETTPSGPQWHRWQQRDDFDASRRTDRHYTLDPETGVVTFGDGERGRIPSSSERLLAVFHRTYGNRGNVSAAAITQPADTPLNHQLTPADWAMLGRITTNPAPAAGGAAPETLTAATGRAVEALWAHDRLDAIGAPAACPTLDQLDPAIVRALRSPSRAVTTLDIERLALDVPGTHVLRARAWSNLDARQPRVRAEGVVTLVIVPALPPNRPQPGLGLRRVVRRYLNRRRMVTTRIEVIGPRYRVISVQAEVQRCPGVDADALVSAIVGALNQFLDPLRGGPARRGWPFGRGVYHAELLQEIDTVDGVEYVRTLTLLDERGEPICGNVCLSPTTLVTPGPHLITVT